MFSNVGWGEILVLLVIGLLLIGPERLPNLIKEVRAVLLAARNAVTEARQQLDGELGEDFREFSKPLRELNSVRRMGAKGFITKTLLDGDDSFLTPFTETKQDLKDTVDILRRHPTPSTTNASDGSSAGDPVEVPQQAELGESRVHEEHPVQEAAQEIQVHRESETAASAVAKAPKPSPESAAKPAASATQLSAEPAQPTTPSAGRSPSAEPAREPAKRSPAVPDLAWDDVL